MRPNYSSGLLARLDAPASQVSTVLILGKQKLTSESAPVTANELAVGGADNCYKSGVVAVIEWLTAFLRRFRGWVGVPSWSS